MVSHNNVIQSVHLRKHWNNTTSNRGRVKTWFDQPGKKLRRSRLRNIKAKIRFPRPADGAFRPVVRCPTIKHFLKIREGRGFSLSELRKAKITQREARTLAISIDHRRRSERIENINRLKAFHARVILNPQPADRIQIKGRAVKLSGYPKKVKAIKIEVAEPIKTETAPKPVIVAKESKKPTK
ncbi:MAG: putative ribosomal protein L13e [Streblomastix strix]|uniref:Putative ribosomal protein L13e n=1 Tax=Streblomastix strix TaxID=222440 RepID=A0A5J4UTX1_9EUKA|nr:MAG: putative ribosomal protein L13e [Streblomastix strix]